MLTIKVDSVTKEWVVAELQTTEENLIQLYAELKSDGSD